MLKETLRSRWFSACLHAGLWLLLLLAIISVGGRTPQYHEAAPDPAAVRTPVPVARLKKLFTPENWPKHVVDAATLNPFTTTHFMPPLPPPPPPPTTRKIELTYQGFYQAGSDNKRVYLQVDGALKLTAVGERVATNLFIADAAIGTLMLTNTTAQTNLLKLNLKQVLEVPIQ